MEEKNKFDTSDNLDDFDKMLFDYYDKQNDDIPFSTQLTIENALKNRRSEKSNYFSLLKKVAVFIACIGIVTATTVYAKDIVSFISNIFTNSNPGIDKAVENGYVQNVDMDFIVCNDVGVKVDYLLMDDHNLDISFVYKYFGEDINPDNIIFNDLSIVDESNNLIFCFSEKQVSYQKDFNIIKTNAKFTESQNLINTQSIRSSLLLSSENFPKSKILTFFISNISITLDNTKNNIIGNWDFSINIENKFAQRNTYTYNTISSSNFINSIETSLGNTSLIINLNLNFWLDELNFLRPSNIRLYDNNNINYVYTNLDIKNLSNNEPYNSVMSITYPITVYDKIDTLYLHINLDSEHSIDIKLLK